jgi:hypothetical protein
VHRTDSEQEHHARQMPNSYATWDADTLRFDFWHQSTVTIHDS